MYATVIDIFFDKLCMHALVIGSMNLIRVCVYANCMHVCVYVCVCGGVYIMGYTAPYSQTCCDLQSHWCVQYACRQCDACIDKSLARARLFTALTNLLYYNAVTIPCQYLQPWYGRLYGGWWLAVVNVLTGWVVHHNLAWYIKGIVFKTVTSGLTIFLCTLFIWYASYHVHVFDLSIALVIYVCVWSYSVC